ncbi:hypothetical protein [Moheibacter sediminis]|uniref:MORN repeat variant n=1 Tax=Moheibacter sediminis TaxID=1434700 RepID=A0A1W1YAI5_9FLAO|nr:hypothetical protein [Moheibacter sediminis]SMC32758.1 hypothetical protein SAMN06296427_101124 [Moheibacter sediminis]
MKIYSLSIILFSVASFFHLNAQIADPVVDSAYVDANDLIEAAEAVAVDAADYTIDGSYGMPQDELEKFNFKKGEPVFVIVNVQHSIPNDSLLAVRELHELKKNFAHLKANFFIVHKNAVLDFQNDSQQEYRLDDYNTQYQSVIFWDGKANSDVYQFESIIQSSEAYSPQLGIDKTSSYVAEFNQKKKELSKYKNETVNQNSAATSKKYISNLFLAEVYYLKNEEHFFTADFKGVKKLTVKSNYKKFKNPVNEAEFDLNGNPTKLILQSDDIDGKKIHLEFSYLSGALKKLVSTYAGEDGKSRNQGEFYYQDGNMYDVHSEESLTKYHLNENGFLLNHGYYFDESRYFILEDHLTFKGKILSYRDYGNLNNRDYTINSLQNFFPVKIAVRNEHFYEIQKKSANEFLINSDESTTKVLLNEKGLISKVIMENLEMDRESKPMDLIFEYFYEYY